MVLTTPTPGGTTADGILSLEVQGARRSFRLLDPTRVGQCESCQIRLFGPTVAPIHCEFRREHGRWIVEAEPAAGTIEINGRPIRTARLDAGDRITIAGIAIDFGSPDDHSTNNPASERASAAAPSLQAEWERLARKHADLDAARANLEAERAAWLARAEAEQRELERSRRSWRDQWRDAERSFQQHRARIEADALGLQADLDQRAEAIALREQNLADRRAALDDEAESQRQQFAAERQLLRTEADEIRRTSASAQRLLVTAQQQREEMRSSESALRESKDQWTLARQQVVEDLAVRRQELSGICERIGRERTLLIQIQREQARLSRVRSNVAPAEPTTEGSASDESRDQREALAVLTAQLERAADAVEAADHRQAAQRIRIMQLARHIELREQESRVIESTASSRADLQRQAAAWEQRERDLRRDLQELVVERARFAAEQAAWRQQSEVDRAAILREREQFRAWRIRLAATQRQRLARHRKRRESLQAERRTIDLRFSHMLRFEARIEATKQELATQRLAAIVEEYDRSQSQSNQGSTKTPRLASIHEAVDAIREQIETGMRRHHASLDRSLQVLDRRESGDRRLPPAAAPTSISSESRTPPEVELYLAMAQHDADARFWLEERKQYQARIASLDGQIENLAASLLGSVLVPRQHQPSAA